MSRAVDDDAYHSASIELLFVMGLYLFQTAVSLLESLFQCRGGLLAHFGGAFVCHVFGGQFRSPLFFASPV